VENGVKPGRVALAVPLLALAVVAALLAADVRGEVDALRAGDLRFVAGAGGVHWAPSPILPGDPAQRLLGTNGDLALRRAAAQAAAARAAGRGYDNGVSESHARAAVEAQLADLSHSGDPRSGSVADTIAGILAFADSKQMGPAAPAPVERSVSDFADAIRRDPGNDDAKFDLELLLRQLVARGTRAGSNNAAGGPAHGHRGAGAGLPGHGY
jgi:hypothetical protein